MTAAWELRQGRLMTAAGDEAAQPRGVIAWTASPAPFGKLEAGAFPEKNG